MKFLVLFLVCSPGVWGYIPPGGGHGENQFQNGQGQQPMGMGGQNHMEGQMGQNGFMEGQQPMMGQGYMEGQQQMGMGQNHMNGQGQGQGQPMRGQGGQEGQFMSQDQFQQMQMQNPQQHQGSPEGGGSNWFSSLFGFGGGEPTTPLPPLPSPCYSQTTPHPLIPPCPYVTQPTPPPRPPPTRPPPPPQRPQTPPPRPRPTPPPVMPYIPEPIPEPSEPQPWFPRCDHPPYIPPGFFLGNNSWSDFCCPRPPPPPPCPTFEMFEKLQLFKIFELIREAKLEVIFTQTSNYTFFAPVDPAFDRLPHWFLASLRKDIKLLQAFVLNHLVKIDMPLPILDNDFHILNARAGGNRLRFNVYFPETEYRIYTVDGSRVLKGDIRTLQGRIHIVDKVLTPNPKRNAAQYLTEIPDFSEFWGAVQDSGMVPLFQQEETPVTVFIPYNPAFKFFDFAAMHGNKTALQNFVKYHVVSGAQYSSGLINGQFLATHYDKEVRVNVVSDGFTKSLSKLNGHIEVLKADIPLQNGVAHIVSRCITTEPAFYFIEEFNEFSYEFGSLRRSFQTD